MGLYLTATQQELAEIPQEKSAAWLACTFRPDGTVTNLPRAIPGGSLLTIADIDLPEAIQLDTVTQQIRDTAEAFGCSGVLLDFQKPWMARLAALRDSLAASLPCPLVVTPPYQDGCSAILLPPVPPDCTLQAYLSPWQGEKIWLEATLEGLTIRMTPIGAQRETKPVRPVPEDCREDTRLHCHYRLTMQENEIVFDLYRTEGDLLALMAEGDPFGICGWIGLWQELGSRSAFVERI